MLIFCFEFNFIEVYKMNDIVSKFLLAGDKFMPERNLKQPRFTIVLVEHLVRIKKEFKI